MTDLTFCVIQFKILVLELWAVDAESAQPVVVGEVTPFDRTGCDLMEHASLVMEPDPRTVHSLLTCA